MTDGHVPFVIGIVGDQPLERRSYFVSVDSKQHLNVWVLRQRASRANELDLIRLRRCEMVVLFFETSKAAHLNDVSSRIAQWQLNTLGSNPLDLACS